MRPNEQTCPGKRQYRTKAYAKLILRRMRDREPGLHAYRCSCCGGFHIGHRARAKAAA